MKTLIIGAAGFVGGYLAKQLIGNGHQTEVTCLENEQFNAADCKVHRLNILDKESIKELFEEVKPDFIFHLAAQSSVSLSWKNPQLTTDINVKGTLNVLDAMRESRIDKSAGILLIGSGEEYGHVREGACPITEDEIPRPGNIYAATKACQSMIGSIYARAYGMKIIMVRAFTHVGPGQLPIFVVSDFCKQTAEIESGQREAVIKVGNLSAKRDFTDVRDVVRAYELIAEKGKAGELYNVGSGHAVEISSVLEKIVGKSKSDIKVEVDSSKLRPVDVPIIEADTTKIYGDTGWKPEITLEQTIDDTLEYWRKRVN